MRAARTGEFAYLKYDPDMERITATFDDETIRGIREVAGPRGVSAFLQAAARERLTRMRLLALADDLDARYGVPTKAVRAAVEREARRVFRR
jgi:hypothetical protein